MSLEPEQLSTFLAVLEQRSISAAARAVHLSQPAVSARIRRLEQTLGTALFDRSARGISPTPAGERLAVRAREIQSLLDLAAAEVGATHELGELELVASTTIAAHALPPVLATFRKEYPDVRFKLRTCNTGEVLDAVRSGTFPLGLVEGHKRTPAVRLEPWVDDEIFPVIGASAPRGWLPRRIEDLEQIPILWREPGSGTRAVVAKALRVAGARSKPVDHDLVLGASEAIASGVAAGLGIGFLSRWSAGPLLQTGRLRMIPALDLTIRRTFHWALPPGGLVGTALHFRQFAQRRPPVPA